MSWLSWLRPRIIILFLLWVLPGLLYAFIGLLALYQTGWLRFIAWTLPLMWLLAWGVGKLWKPPKLGIAARGNRLVAPHFWTPLDSAAIEIVEEFRSQVADIDRISIADPTRYIADAEALGERLAEHYYSTGKNAWHPLTIVEILAVIHLAAEDLEAWVQANVPGSSLATLGHLEQLPRAAKALDISQSLLFVLTAATNPAKLLAYPLWRKAASVAVELQNEMVRALYQRYLRQVGFYLIEMYSGRLRGGSKRYREQFGHLSAAVHAAGGKTAAFEQLDETSTTIAVMGQVKAGKSSLINALMQKRVATTSILPETRQVQQYDYRLPGSSKVLTLLDTPGYDEADVSKKQRREIQIATERADVILLVMAANSSARDTDLRLLQELSRHYTKHSNLKAPPVIAVLTHIDLLRPVREWSPPYNWREPVSDKEHSMARAVAYTRQLFGNSLAGYACVYTGELYADSASVADELVPCLLGQLDQGHSVAVLKAFYKQLSQERLQRLTQNFSGLIKSVGRSILDNP